MSEVRIWQEVSLKCEEIDPRLAREYRDAMDLEAGRIRQDSVEGLAGAIQ